MSNQTNAGPVRCESDRAFCFLGGDLALAFSARNPREIQRRDRHRSRFGRDSALVAIVQGYDNRQQLREKQKARPG